MGLKIFNNTDISNLYNSISKIDKGTSIDYAVNIFPKIKRGFLFLNLQEYYRQIENNEFIINKFINDKTPSNIKIVLKICLTLIFHSKKPHYALVNEAVEFSKKFKKGSLVNGVLREVLRKKNSVKNNKQNVPKLFKTNCDKIYTSSKIRSYIYKSFFTKPKSFQISLNDNVNNFYKKRVSLLNDKLCANYFVQDIGNFEIINSVKSLYNDQKILDVCAAPGGKSILLSSYGFKVEALDKSQNQIDKFIENVKRLKLDIKISKKNFLESKISSKYNSILLDAPCSALGTFRRNPDVVSKIDEEKLIINQNIQVKMVDKSLNLLNKGGVLVYIVCSFHSFETMGVIDKILQKHKNITIEKIQSDKMIKRENGYFTNPYSFKEFGGSDIFFVTVLRKKK